jgi:hypothetical protein
MSKLFYKKNEQIEFKEYREFVSQNLLFNPPNGYKDEARENSYYQFCFFKNWFRGNYRISKGEVAFFDEELQKI